MDQINVEKPFILYCNASIRYDGRAKSTCTSGNYVVIRKGDGSLQIHGNSLSKPLNYQGVGAIMWKENNQLISVRKKETIVLFINTIIQYTELNDWTTNKIELTGSESDYRDKYITHLNRKNIKEMHKEFKTPLGSIDLLILDKNNVYHIYEMKRRRASLNGCSQLLRYFEYFESVSGKLCKGYLVAPSITENALRFLIDHKADFIQFEMDLD